MHFTKDDILKMGKIDRLNLINSVTGAKPANLIGTVSKNGKTNLAIFSSVVHLGSNPALIGMVLRPQGDVPRHTFQNIQDTGVYTINHVPATMTGQAHYTSAKFSEEESEFDTCGFEAVYMDGFAAPFVRQSPVVLAMKFEEEVPIKANGTSMIIGAVQDVFVEDEFLMEQNHIDLEKAGTAAISGLNTYYRMQKIETYPYARVSELPDFKNS